MIQMSELPFWRSRWNTISRPSREKRGWLPRVSGRCSSEPSVISRMIESTFECPSCFTNTTVCPSGETSGCQQPVVPGRSTSPSSSVLIQIAPADLPPGRTTGPCHAVRIGPSAMPAPVPTRFFDTAIHALVSRFQVHSRRFPVIGSIRPIKSRAPSALQSSGNVPMPESGTSVISPVRGCRIPSEVRSLVFFLSSLS